jgi:hypothetical protein
MVPIIYEDCLPARPISITATLRKIFSKYVAAPLCDAGEDIPK